MRDTKYGSFRLTAISLAVIGMSLAGGVSAGVIRNTNQDLAPGAFKADCGVVGTPTACVGAWNLDNVDVKLYSANGTEFGSFDEATGTYTTMTPGDYFTSWVNDALGVSMAKVSGKIWPVGEPTGIKSVVDDPQVSKGKPQNCIINTAFLSPENSTVPDANYLDSAHPQPVICSSPFQTHKRFKIAMQPATVDGVADGAEGKGIDMVFNVADDGTLRPYQVFSKINNYTGKRLSGYKIVVGTGTGVDFKSASELGIADKLHISLGIGEGASGGGNNLVYDGTDLFESDGLATFSHGLFGAPDNHFEFNGFFDKRTAGFNVAQKCVTEPAVLCPTYANANYPAGVPLIASDTIYSTTALESNYVGPVMSGTLGLTTVTGLPFGEWLPSKWQPKGIFFDDDLDPNTDAILTAWWNGTEWRGNFDSDFKLFTQEEINYLAADPQGRYAIDDIEDVLNLGINYIVKVGDGIPEGKFTVRIIPVVAATQVLPAWCPNADCAQNPPFGDGGGTTPVDPPDDGVIPEPPMPPVYEVPPTDPTTPTPTVPVVTSSDGGGGGCAIGNDGRFDPTLPAMLFAGLGFLGWRRYKAGK